MGKDLQRRIAKLKEENKDPSLPQKAARAPTAGPSTSVSPPLQSAPSPPPQVQNQLSESQQMVDESFMLLGQRVRSLHCSMSWVIAHAPRRRVTQETRSISSGRPPKACWNTSLDLSHLLPLHSHLRTQI